MEGHDPNDITFALLTLIVWLPSRFVCAWFLRWPYEWFAVSLGAPEIGAWHLLGLAVLIGGVRVKVSPEDVVRQRVMRKRDPEIRPTWRDRLLIQLLYAPYGALIALVSWPVAWAGGLL